MKKVLIILLCLLTMFSGVSCESINSTKKDEGKEYAEMIEKSKKSIAPYLEYLPSKLNEDGKIEINSELNKNKSNVYFCGMIGTVSYHKNKYGNGVDELVWASNEFYTYEEDKAMADVLSDYFGEPAIVEYEQYGQYNDTTYYWTDKSVPCTVILYTSVRTNYEDKKDRIEIYWDMDKDIPN